MEYAAAAAAIATVAAAAIQTYSSVRQSQQQAELADVEAKQAKIDRQAITEATAFEEKQRRRELRLALGKQEAVFAASGVDPSEGTPLFTMLDSIREAELEALSIRAQGGQAAQSRGFEGQLAGYRRRSIRSQIPWQIAGGVTSGVAGAVSSYYGIKGAAARTPTRKSTVAGEWRGGYD